MSYRTIVAWSAFAIGLIIGDLSIANATVIDFDDLTPGDIVTEIDGVTISANIPGLNLVVASGLETTSGANYLGVDDGGSQAFLGGDEITFDFAAPVVSFSVSVIASFNPFPAGAYTLSSGALSDVSTGATDVLPAGDEVFTLFIASATSFTQAVLTSAFGVSSFNIDDVIFRLDATDPPAEVPLPGAILFFLSGVAGLGARYRLKRLPD